MHRTWRAANLWREGRWQDRTDLWVDGAGMVDELRTPAPGDAGEALGRWVLPGMVNVHSHAFQRAMAGRVEQRLHERDSFWTWRELMYAFAARLDPDLLRAVAAQAYVEMLQAGYTRVCEFHYVHRRPDGGAYADPAAMSLALVEAAEQAGIQLTLLPVLYMTGGFDGRPLDARQRRFALDVDAFLALVERLRGLRRPGFNVGIALHSLRAVPPDALRAVLDARIVHDLPVHIHIAEQPAEVADCVAARGMRPVEWLLANADVNARWCLVHATHVEHEEVLGMAASGATVGLCPTTEGNLGDGIFPLGAYLGAGGHIAVGSDSNVSTSPVEELRWLEYGQRLTAGRRHVAAGTDVASVGTALWHAALTGGTRVAAQPPALAPGSPADLLVLDVHAPALAGHDATTLLDALVFAGNAPLVRDVMVAGRWRVRDFHHHDAAAIARGYAAAVRKLLDAGA